MKEWITRYLTTETLLFGFGFLWAVTSSAIPAVPKAIPVPALIPGLTEVTPGLFLLVGLVPLAIKIGVPGAVPFVHGVKSTEEPKDA